MVAINSLTVTSAVLLSVAHQAVAAPINLDTRVPKGTKTGLAHHIISTAGHVGAAFAGARRDVDDLETRAPKGTKTGLAHSVIGAAGHVGAAFAGARRDVDDLETRAPKGTKTGLAHSVIGAAGHVGAAFAGARRDVDDLETRVPKGTKTGLAHHIISTAGHVGAAFAGARDVDDLEERDDLEELDERDLDEELYELYSRDLDTRVPKGTKTGLAHHAISVVGKVGAAFAGARRDLEEDDLVARALEQLDERDLMDIYARYFEDAEDFE